MCFSGIGPSMSCNQAVPRAAVLLQRHSPHHTLFVHSSTLQQNSVQIHFYCFARRLQKRFPDSSNLMESKKPRFKINRNNAQCCLDKPT